MVQGRGGRCSASSSYCGWWWILASYLQSKGESILLDHVLRKSATATSQVCTAGSPKAVLSQALLAQLQRGSCTVSLGKEARSTGGVLAQSARPCTACSCVWLFSALK